MIMQANKKSEGFTLLELMITILIGSIITLATTTILLLGLRLNNESVTTVEKQNTTRILLSALEDLATEGTIKEIVQTDEESWKIIGDIEKGVIFTYDAESKIIYTGNAATGTPLLEEVLASSVNMDENNILTFSVETVEGVYSSSVYCRTVPAVSDVKKEELFEEVKNNNIIIDNDGAQTSQARTAFLKRLASQYGSNGVIITNPSSETLTYYSQWYIGNKVWGEGESAETWNASTPWCACFVSWALAQMRTEGYIDNIPCESHVSKYVEYLKNSGNAIWKISDPIPGDLIVFDWDKEEENGVDHVGVVLKVETKDEKTTVYTIEGNTANMVAVRSYDINDSDIVGYGVLDWKTNTELGVVDNS